MKFWKPFVFLACSGLFLSAAPLRAASPSITSLSVTSGPVGTSVTITGTNFGSPQGTSTVTFNGSAATVSTWGSTSILVTVPSAATTGNVVVTVSGVASNGKSFTVIPNITNLSVASGVVGASVTVTGTTFGSSQGTSTVKFNGTSATVTTWSSTSIAVTVPAAATTGNVVITVSSEASNGKSFTVIPNIKSLSVTSGAVGASVTVTGTTFGSSQGSSTIKFNGTTATATSWSASSIVTTVPSGATSGNIVVTVSGEASSGVSFTVVPAPTITAFSPGSAGVGMSVTISGTSFGSTQGNGKVTFNSGKVATIGTWSATSIATTVPTGATTGNVLVNASGVNSAGLSFTVLPTPTISSLAPAAGAIGATVTITGTNFGSSQGTSAISFNGVAPSVTSWASTKIVAVVASGTTTGPVTVKVSNVPNAGTTFTVTPPPSITGISPPSSVTGTAVTISGSNFGATQGTSTVAFNGAIATITSWGNLSISATVPAGATSGPVVVTASGVPSPGYSYTVPPTITAVSPNPAASGILPTITGTNFGTTQGSSTVTFNGTVFSVVSWNATTIKLGSSIGIASSPAVVTVNGVASNSFAFTIVPDATLNSVVPNSAAVGTPVTIYGGNFGASQSTSVVTIDGAVGTPTSWSPTKIIVPVPTGATSSGDVVVTVGGNPAYPELPFSVPLRPNISGLSITTGAIGTAVTITGTNFGTQLVASTVTFNGTVATSTTWSNTSIVATVPVGATTGPVVVTVNYDASTGITFTVPQSPAIQSLSTTLGPVGTALSINGVGFGPTAGTVTFNGTSATTTSWSNTSIACTVPAGASSGPVVATSAGKSSNGYPFTVTGNGSLSGIVTSASNGSPITGATIQALQAGSVKASATSSSTGNYSIATLASGIYDIKFSATGYGSAIVNSISISIGGAATQNESLSSPGSITGTITQSNGTTPISGAGVVASQGAESAGSATANSNGTYTVSGLGAGSYTVLAQAPGFVPNSQPSVSVAGGSTATANISLAGLGTDTINYVYDQVGRLVGVIDAQGGAATYSYDAVGNIVSISTGSSSQTSIMQFTPSSAAVGTTVTIYGTGFSSTASQDAVAFNGVSATVSSATSTQIVTAVPTSATSGSISVTTPAGRTTSSSAFTVITSAGGPTISSFTPATTSGGALQGTPVTITGTNFDLPANTKVKFNTTKVMTPLTGSSTTIQTAAPEFGTSGHVTVTTPLGTAISAGDFFYTFLPGGGNQFTIVSTGRINFGTTTVTVPSAGDALILIDGVAGQGVSVSIGNSNFSSSGSCTLALYDPNGTLLFDPDCSSQSANTGQFAEKSLQTTGSAEIDVHTTVAGAVTFTIGIVPPNITAPITINGSPVTEATTAAGQGITLTFSGTSGQPVTVNWSGSTLVSYELLVYQPNGTIWEEAGGYSIGASGSIPSAALPATGSYSIQVIPFTTTYGSITVTLTSP